MIPQTISDQIAQGYCLDARRAAKARNLAERGAFRQLPNGNIQVQSETNARRFYQVNPREFRCNCADWIKHNANGAPAEQNGICKHIAAWLMHREMLAQKPKMTWDEFIRDIFGPNPQAGKTIAQPGRTECK